MHAGRGIYPADTQDKRHDYVRFRFRQALVEAKGFEIFIAMGPTRGSGCYCFANDLLSECITRLERDYRFIVIDTEAGMEHISRGTIGKPDMLSDRKRSRCTRIAYVCPIREIATRLGLEKEKIFIVFNRYKSATAPVNFGIDSLIAIIPDDAAVAAADLYTTPVPHVPADSPALGAVIELVQDNNQISA